MIDPLFLNFQFLVHTKLAKSSRCLQRHAAHRLLLQHLRTSEQVALGDDSNGEDEAISIIVDCQDQGKRREVGPEQDDSFVIDLTRMFAELSLSKQT